MNQIPDSPPPLPSRGRWGRSRVGLFVISLVVLLGGYIAVDFGLVVRSDSRLSQLGVALCNFASDHGGSFPASLQQLVPEYIGDPSVFIDPNRRSTAGAIEEVAAWTDYAYVSGYQAEKDRSDCAIVVEMPGRPRLPSMFRHRGGWIIYAGGLHRYIPESELLARLRAPWAPGLGVSEVADLQARVKIILPKKAKQPARE